MQAKNIVVVVLVLVLLGVIGFLLFSKSSETTIIKEPAPEPTEMPLPVEPDGGIGDGAQPLPEATETVREPEAVIGRSVNGKDIVAYHFGSGNKEILLVAGVHGSYSPNTSLLADDLISYFKDNESKIPGNLSVTIIPNLNPDGGDKGGTAGRFNAHDVDLNRNFDCEWKTTGVWKDREVSGGSAPFSEPEAEALRNYVLKYDPAAAIVWFSAEGKVYPSACESAPSKQSVTLAATFATAAGYPAEAEFNAYAITGDMVNWMAKQDIPAISVLLSDHKSTELSKNRAGIEAVLNAYAE